MHAGEQVRVDDVLGPAVGDHLLVGGVRVGLVGGDECRPNIGEVGAHGLRGQEIFARGDGAGQGDETIPAVAQLANEGKRRQRPRVAPRACGNCDQAVGPLLERLAREALVACASSSLIRASHSSSNAAGRASSAGKLPTTPALHCAITRSGLEIMNSGAAITGSESRPARSVGSLVLPYRAETAVGRSTQAAAVGSA